MFARNQSLAEISRSVGGVPVGTLGAIMYRARRAGDPRAFRQRLIRRATAPAARARPKPRTESESQSFRRQRLARAFPSTPAELGEAIARASVPVRRLRPGIASDGWRPSWLRI